ncbi:uncharacterized protein LOC105206643 [Solenopsis invicta]|uniref:uncharacterized protein LOC105206643 n=1 Tax=Solenopsis invicta TaxID=13686 RepID=UPI00193D175F|nr:uncharacterized protein LOC105206643 [Solenopsis invicta]
MSEFVPNKEHSRTVLIFCFYLKKTAAESYGLLREAYGEHAPSQRTQKPPKRYEDVELQSLLDEDDSQTQTQLAEQLSVNQQAMEVNKRQSWSLNQLKAAVKAVQNKEMGYLKASKQFNVPKRTIERKTKKIAGKKWLKGFLRRHPILSIRTPQSVSSARVKGFTKENVAKFFDIYESQLLKIKYSPNRLYNVDETGITVVQHKHSKVISMKGKKQVYALTSLERGKLITIVTCKNASGHYIPPLIIFPRKNRSPELMNGTLPGSIEGYHPSGWIQTDLFTMWLKHFIQHTKPTEDDPIVLVLDGHYTHTRNIEVINIARENHILIVCLPPHSTHKMQPLDVGFMFPLKTYYAQAIESWLRHNPGRVVTNRQVGMLFGEAYQKAATMNNSINAFKKTGLFPCNRYAFSEEHFRIYDGSENPSPIIDCPSAINDDEILSMEANKENQNVSGNLSPIPGCSQDIQGPSQDTEVMMSPFQIRPVPTITQKQNKSTRAQSAHLVTSSPHKKQVEDSLKRRKEKEPKITAKNKGRGKNKTKKIKKKLESSSKDDNDVQTHCELALLSTICQ